MAWPVCATPELKDRLSQEEWHRLSGHLTAGSDLGLSGHSAVGSAWWGLSGCLSGHWAVGSDRSGLSGGLSGHLAVGSDQLCLWRLLVGAGSHLGLSGHLAAGSDCVLSAQVAAGVPLPQFASGSDWVLSG